MYGHSEEEQGKYDTVPSLLNTMICMFFFYIFFIPTHSVLVNAKLSQ